MTTLEFSAPSAEQISLTEFQEALGAIASTNEVELFTAATTETITSFDSAM